MKSFFTTILLVVVLIPTSVFAEEAANNFLVGIPGVGDPTGDFDGYINAIYAMFISLAALLAVVKIVIAGVKYMFSDIVTQKSQAKKDIQGALFGLVIVLGAVLILTVINPDLTNFNLDTDMIERPDRSTPGAEDPLSDGFLDVQEYCEVNQSNCEVKPCDALGNYSWELIAAGAALGSVVPGVGTLAGAASGAGAWALQLAGNYAACAATCAWLEGEMVESNGIQVCQHPTDALAAQTAILEARRQILREQNDCLDGRLVILGDGSSNCIRDLTDTESQNVLTALEVDPDSTVAQSIIDRIQNFAIQDYLVSDTTTIDELTQTFNAERIVMALEIPMGTDAFDKTNIETNFEGICVDAGFDTIFETVDGIQYAACGE